MLVDDKGKFKVPVVFVTNAGNTLRQNKAKALSEWLDIKVHVYLFWPASFHFLILHHAFNI